MILEFLADHWLEFVGTASTVLTAIGTVLTIYARFRQARLPSKVKRLTTLDALTDGLIVFCNMLRDYPANQLVEMLHRLDVLPLEMKKDLRALAEALGVASPPPRPDYVLPSPEEEANLNAEVDLLFHMMVSEMDLNLAREDAQKAQALQTRILAKFRAPIAKVREKMVAHQADLEKELARVKGRLASLHGE
jgi:hypothetical protein